MDRGDSVLVDRFRCTLNKVVEQKKPMAQQCLYNNIRDGQAAMNDCFCLILRKVKEQYET